MCTVGIFEITLYELEVVLQLLNWNYKVYFYVFFFFVFILKNVHEDQDVNKNSEKNFFYLETSPIVIRSLCRTIPSSRCFLSAKKEIFPHKEGNRLLREKKFKR